MQQLRQPLGGLNAFLNELAYKPKGGSSKQSYLFYLPWVNHDFNAAFNLQDAGGPLLRGLILIILHRRRRSATGRSPRRSPCSRRCSKSRRVPRTTEIPVPVGEKSESGHCEYKPTELRRMSKRAPSTTQLLVIVGFALSCFGILLFLWVTFGGPTPFKAKPYQIKVPFNEATQLAEQSDVRISGVNVGKVQNIELAPNGKQALATVDIDDKYAPLPRVDAGDPAHQDAARRDLHRTDARQPRRAAARRRRHRARGATSPNRSSSTRSSAPSTRRRAERSRPGCRKPRSRSTARARRSPTRSASSNRPSPNSTSSSASSTRQRLAVAQLFRNGATTFRALRGREGELANLIRSSNAVFQTTARAQPRHRSAVPRLPDLPRRVEADAEPAEGVLASTPTR